MTTLSPFNSKKSSIILVAFVVAVALLPFLLSVFAHHKILETPRWNLTRAPIQTSTFVAPFQTFETTFVPSDDYFSRLDLFMRPSPVTSWGDRYRVLIQDVDSGEQRKWFEFGVLSLWDDVASFRFEPFLNSKDHSFRLTLKTDLSNRSSVQLATPLNDSEALILQPYYEQPLSFFEALTIALNRFSWRLFPLGLVIPLLGVVLGRFIPNSK